MRYTKITYTLFSVFIVVCFSHLLKAQVQATDNEVYEKINTFNTSYQRKLCKALYDSVISSFHIEYLQYNIQSLTPQDFYREIVSMENVDLVILSYCKTSPTCDYQLAAFDKEANLLSFLSTAEGRHSTPSFEVKNYDHDKDVEILVKIPDYPSLNSFEEITLWLYKFNHKTRKLVCVWVEFPYVFNYLHFCSRTDRTFSFLGKKIKVQEQYVRLVCNNADIYKHDDLKAATPVITTNYMYEWNEKEFKYIINAKDKKRLDKIRELRQKEEIKAATD